MISDLKGANGHAAVATYTTTDKGKDKGQDIGGRYRWTDVFVRRAGKWTSLLGTTDLHCPAGEVTLETGRSRTPARPPELPLATASRDCE